MTLDDPEGYRTITPYLTVPDADQLIAFLQAVFEGQVVKQDRGDDGRIRHARVRIGDSVIMLNEASAEYPANHSQMHVYTADVEATFTRALEEGASAIMTPNRRPYGNRMAGVRDPCGNTWWIASQA